MRRRCKFFVGACVRLFLTRLGRLRRSHRHDGDDERRARVRTRVAQHGATAHGARGGHPLAVAAHALAAEEPVGVDGGAAAAHPPAAAHSRRPGGAGGGVAQGQKRQRVRQHRQGSARRTARSVTIFFYTRDI